MLFLSYPSLRKSRKSNSTCTCTETYKLRFPYSLCINVSLHGLQQIAPWIGKRVEPRNKEEDSTSGSPFMVVASPLPSYLSHHFGFWVALILFVLACLLSGYQEPRKTRGSLSTFSRSAEFSYIEATSLPIINILLLPIQDSQAVFLVSGYLYFYSLVSSLLAKRAW
jgi:hypothetical protein